VAQTKQKTHPDICAGKGRCWQLFTQTKVTKFDLVLAVEEDCKWWNRQTNIQSVTSVRTILGLQITMKNCRLALSRWRLRMKLE